MKSSKTPERLFFLLVVLLALIGLFYITFVYTDNAIISEEVQEELEANKTVIIVQTTGLENDPAIISLMINNNYVFEFEVYEISKQDSRRIALGFVTKKKRTLQEIRRLIDEINWLIEERFGKPKEKTYNVRFRDDDILVIPN